MTNEEAIRTCSKMDVEEMAYFLSRMMDCSTCRRISEGRDYCTMEDCAYTVLNWLKAKMKEYRRDG